MRRSVMHNVSVRVVRPAQAVAHTVVQVVDWWTEPKRRNVVVIQLLLQAIVEKKRSSDRKK